MTDKALPSSNWVGAEPDGKYDDGFHLDLERYWVEARGLRYWIAGIVVAGILLALVVTLLSTELFRASARLEVSQITANVTAIDPLENESRISELQYLNTQYELLNRASWPNAFRRLATCCARRSF